MTSNVLLFMVIPALAALGGGVLAVLWHPNREVRSLIQHFAAGVVLAALAVELLPDIEREHAPGLVLIAAFAVGSLFMFGLKIWTKPIEHVEGEETILLGIPSGLLLATFLDVAVDGFIIGAGFAAGGKTGSILAIGLAVELLFLGLALTSDAARGWKILVVSGGLSVIVFLFAVLGSVLLEGATPTVMGGVLAFSAAALLYLVTEELLMEAHEVPEHPISTLVLFSGFLIFWSIQLVGG